jgi:hypothetical protein
MVEDTADFVQAMHALHSGELAEPVEQEKPAGS